MAEEPLAFDHSKLSPRDQEVLRAFLATNEFETLPPDSDGMTAPPMPQPVDPTLDLEDEMMSVFATEVEEDLTVMRGGLEQAERDEVVDSPGFLTLQQVAHKIRGSAAMIGCDAMSTIAHHIEIVIQQITAGEITVYTGLYGLGHAVGAIEMTLESVVTQKREDSLPLLGLEHDFETRGISLTERSEEPLPTSRVDVGQLGTRGGMSVSTLYEARSSSVQDTGRNPRDRPGSPDQLIQHTEHLIEQQTALEHARKQVEVAFQELQTAQARLKRIENFFSSMFMPMATASLENTENGATSSSSLVARILREAAQRTGRTYQFQTNSQPPSLEDATRWDELEMDRFSETNLLVYALNEVIGDIATATAQLQHALARLDTLMGQHITTTQQVHAGFILHFPQATRLAQGLLVRAWEQQVIIPFSQVSRIDYQRRDDEYDNVYTLNALLGFPTTPIASVSPVTPAVSLIQPVLRLSMDTQPVTQIGVQVDEVIGQVELLIKLLPAPLRRPGITGTAIDSAGNVLLVLDVPELIRQDSLHQGQTGNVSAHDTAHKTKNTKHKILIADDSVSIRRTIRQTLSQKDYVILEASDGSEALEKIEEESPSLLLLDLEMPKMNGYDVLNVLRTRSLSPDLKIVLLTSRASNKHKQRAHELGAHKFLTKPCSENTLLETVATLLAQ
jgi:CheY-like chemotaxis protein/HPt (histidine-containing phosphotransfer) domain-containing protein